MKKFLNLFLLVLGIILTSCEYQNPDVVISPSKLFMNVGDSTWVEVNHAKNIKYGYSKSRKADKPVFSISNFDGEKTQIHALNPGIDTLYISYQWQAGIGAYGGDWRIIVKVME